ncbi:MAG: proline--tRNA ligase [Alphaproteobacteria bacterium 16-39-46]|nr:MAG: proline--tRNA ligase [Alphaproteobacteria bacterium 16-39-46]OZA42855.1 MAG: proline--tRNA ligase [Alphaproteobacteria bacterium 17-39-52]HQS84244.1 proline--tRNA ligase [Alphaproteobacteria bacterium]HQS94104.1 proline--tRNA ligase [Alphaproteobacteria bacterium]
MRWSTYFLPTLKEVPVEAQIPSHRLMLRAGMICLSSSGIYTWLPFGLRVLKNIETIVREEQERAGAQEVLMPTIQSADLWRESGRYDDYGKEMLRIRDRHEREMLYGPTNEELITDVFRRFVKTYRDLPKNLYQIQWKFRDEIRPRFGIMRGREFLMKDNYSFDIDKEGAYNSYRKMFEAYLRTFARLGVVAIPVKADSGAIGGDMSQEFHVLAETGESKVFYDVAFEELRHKDLASLDIEKLRNLYAAAEEKHDPQTCPVAPENLKEARGIEVGHIFYFGTKYSEPMKATVTGEDGQLIPVEMGSYGIGVSRLVAAIIEASHDAAGIIWPESVAPFCIGLINLKVGNPDTDKASETLYDALQKENVEVLYDDRDLRAGSKFADMDLIGLPWQIVVGGRSLSMNKIEVKCRKTGLREDLSINEVIKKFTKSTISDGKCV